MAGVVWGEAWMAQLHLARSTQRMPFPTQGCPALPAVSGLGGTEFAMGWCGETFQNRKIQKEKQQMQLLLPNSWGGGRSVCWEGFAGVRKGPVAVTPWNGPDSK